MQTGQYIDTITCVLHQSRTRYGSKTLHINQVLVLNILNTSLLLPRRRWTLIKFSSDRDNHRVIVGAATSNLYLCKSQAGIRIQEVSCHVRVLVAAAVNHRRSDSAECCQGETPCPFVVHLSRLASTPDKMGRRPPC